MQSVCVIQENWLLWSRYDPSSLTFGHLYIWLKLCGTTQVPQRITSISPALVRKNSPVNGESSGGGRAASQLIRTRSAQLSSQLDHMLEALLYVGILKHWLYLELSSNPDLRRTELSQGVALQRTSSNSSSSSSTPSSQGGSQPGSSERNQPKGENAVSGVILSFCNEDKTILEYNSRNLLN